MRRVLLLFISFLAFTDSNRATRRQTRQEQISDGPQSKLLVIVIDGLRHDHLKRFSARTGKVFPGFRQIRAEGLHTKYLKSVFPTESFPTWQTISTGLYPGNHGIIGKQFYDTNVPGNDEENKYFDHSDYRRTENHKWWAEHEPIWITAAKQHKKFALYLWSRCDITWSDSTVLGPNYCESYFNADPSKSLMINIDRSLLKFQTNEVDAAIIYEKSFGETAEGFGPFSNQAEKALRDLDSQIEFLLNRLRQTNMQDNVNVIVMSDHGMTYGSNPIAHYHPDIFRHEAVHVQKIPLFRIIRQTKIRIRRVVGHGAYAMLYPQFPGETERIVKFLRTHLEDQNYKGLEVYMRDEIPEELHWDHALTPPILLLAHAGTVILPAAANLQRPTVKGANSYYMLDQAKQGINGYDPAEPDMWGVFMATGPGFNPQLEAYPEIELVDVYQIFCNLLGIEPLENDGIWERIKALLRNSASFGQASIILMMVSLACSWVTNTVLAK